MTEGPIYKTDHAPNAKMSIRDGTYLAPKALRIMELLAQGRGVFWIAEALGVTVIYVTYVAKMTGFKTREYGSRGKDVRREFSDKAGRYRRGITFTGKQFADDGDKWDDGDDPGSESDTSFW